MKYATKEYSDAIKNYMEKLGISKEEAVQLWKDDHEDYESPEMKEMGRKAKKMGHREKSDTPRKKTSRERKVDEEKKHLIACYRVFMMGYEGATVTAVKNEAEISFTLNGNSYTLKLIKHRAPK